MGDIYEIRAPWTPQQVEALNRFQAERRMHPFTCGRRDQHRDNEGILVATVHGWHCPVDDCGYTQDWALSFMVTDLKPLFQPRDAG
jgi:hypothetical protein